MSFQPLGFRPKGNGRNAFASHYGKKLHRLYYFYRYVTPNIPIGNFLVLFLFLKFKKLKEKEKL